MNDDTKKKIVLAVILSAIVTWQLKPSVVSPQPRRPVLAWIANTARAVGLAFLFARFTEEEPQVSRIAGASGLAMSAHTPDLPVMRALAEDGNPLLDNGEGW